MSDFAIFQYFCTAMMLLLAVLTGGTHFCLQHRNRRYEQSRCAIVAVLVLFGLHHLIRATLGDESYSHFLSLILCATAEALLAFALLNMLLGGGKMHRKVFFPGFALYVLAVLSSLVGIAAQDRQAVETAFFVDVALCEAMLFYCIALIYKRFSKVKYRLDHELGYPFCAYKRTIVAALFLLCAFILMPLCLFFAKPLLPLVASFTLLITMLFVVFFIALGIHLPKNLIEIAVASGTTHGTRAHMHTMTAERIEMIEKAIAQWLNEEGYKDSCLTLAAFARRTNLRRSFITSYLTYIHGTTFCEWLSVMRIREAKRLLAAHPDYSDETLASACGFYSCSCFRLVFKKKTGMTPAAWRESAAARE